MLVLTRKVGETVIIGDNVTLTVLSITGSQIKLGITAPKDVSVHREEIYKKIQIEGDNRAKQSFCQCEPLIAAHSNYGAYQ